MRVEPGLQVTPNVRIERQLGQGGMGAVWVAEHLTLDKRVAVKFIALEHLQRGGELSLARFKREAKAAARIQSPHIVQIHDQGAMPNGTPYIVMELLAGESLGERLRRLGRLPLAEAGHIIEQTARALGAAHQAGIVHRDIKPDNIFLTASGDDALFVKVLDFGVAKQLGGPVDGEMTSTGAIVGSPRFMSPEQLLDPKSTGASADLWALSVVAYQMLTGTPPFDADSMTGLCLKICEARYLLPSQLGLPAGLDGFFRRAFARAPGERFATARELVEGFQQALRDVAAGRAGPGPALRTLPLVESRDEVPGHRTFEGATTPVQPSKGGRSWLIAGGALAALGAAAFGAWYLNREGQAPRPSQTVVAPAASPAPPPAIASARPPEPALPPGMVLVPAGKYWVGCDPRRDAACFPDEKPGREVEVRAFALMRHEVTVGEYAACVTAGACEETPRSAGCIAGGAGNRPINCVSWSRASAYCAHRGWRLPSEIEWEAAARGGDRRAFPWGDDEASCRRTHIAGCGEAAPLAVGSRPEDRSPAGVLDLGGNLREWTASDYLAYPGGSVDASSSGKVNRGGSYLMTAAQALRSHTRGVDPPDQSRPDLGFRCAADR